MTSIKKIFLKKIKKEAKMLTFISFLIVLFGCINWLSIGMLQYDIVAGFFGTQASIFSRIIYIVIGFAAFWFIVSAIRQRGKVNLFKNKSENQAYAQQEVRGHGEEYERMETNRRSF
jgi:hypothetical protein